MTDNLEQTVLGSLLADYHYHSHALGIVRHFHFYETKHQHIFRAIENLNEGQVPVDVVTVTQEVKKLGLLETVGGAYYISSLTEYRTFSQIEQYCYFVLEAFLKTQIQILGATMQGRAKEPVSDPFEIIGDAEKSLADLISGIAAKKTETVGEIRTEVLAEMDRVLTSGKRSGILCSIDRLNKQTSGWQKGHLIIVAGRPGMGKTAAAVDFALTPAINGEPVAFFSMEMPKEEITGRIMSIQSHIPAQEIVNKTLNRDNLNYLTKNSEGLQSVPLYIDDTPALTLHQLRTRARKLKKEKGIKLIIVDYLQLMTGGKKGANREQEISEISRGLKALAKELELPIIALSQLNRGVEDRADKKPALSDLRESGAIEQDADMVIFLLRPEYYHLTSYQIGNEEINAEGLMVFIIAKFRNGSPGEIRAKFIAQNTMIANYNN